MTSPLKSTRTQFLPFSKPSIGEEEIAEVVDSLRSGWITTGPKVRKFEQAFAAATGAEFAVAVSSCTAALHLSLAALDIGPGDEVIVPTMTFCSTANVVVHQGATPVLVDVTEDLLMDVEAVKKAVTPRTKAIIPVHYAGQACDLDAIGEIAAEHGLTVIEDAAHAAGAAYKGRQIGSNSKSVAFSFYATKTLAIGEGGMITSNDQAFADRCRLMSLHGMSRDAWKRYTQAGSWYYDVVAAGFKNNLTDVQAAIGIHQLAKLDKLNARRMELALKYDEAFADIPSLRVPRRLADRVHAYHLYHIQLLPGAKMTRNDFIDALRAVNIGTSVHFIPLHRHPFYQGQPYGYRPEQFPVADSVFEGIVSLPLFPAMTNDDADDVIREVRRLLS